MRMSPQAAQFRLFSPSAVLVWLNLMVSFWALIPTLLVHSIAPAFASMRYLGGVALLAGMFGLFALPAIGEAGFAICVPVVVPASVLLPALLLSRKLPWTVKLLTTAIELAAFGVMYHTVALLHMQYLRGLLRN